MGFREINAHFLGIFISALLSVPSAEAGTLTQKILRKAKATSAGLALRMIDPTFQSIACQKIQDFDRRLAAPSAKTPAGKKELLASLHQDRDLLQGNLKEANLSEKVILRDLLKEVDLLDQSVKSGRPEDAREIVAVYEQGLRCGK